jgi:hypothetical protein
MSHRSPKPLAIVTAGLCLGLSPSALAVPVGTTPDTRPAAPEQRQAWKTQGITVQFGGTYLQGNVDLGAVNAAVGYTRNWGAHQLFFDAANTLTVISGVPVVNRANGSLLYAYGVRDNLNLFGYTTHTFDSSIKLNYRLTNGIGLCLHRIGTPTLTLGLVSLAMSLENEWYQGDVTRTTPRAVLRNSYTWPVLPNLDLGVDAFYMPAVTDIGNYRLYGEAFAKVAITPDALALKMSVADEFNSLPLPGVKNNDFGAFTTLSFSWGS